MLNTSYLLLMRPAPVLDLSKHTWAVEWKEIPIPVLQI